MCPAPPYQEAVVVPMETMFLHSLKDVKLTEGFQL